MIKNDKIELTNFNFFDFQPKMVDFKAEVINGLSKKNKTLHPKLFYDARGSQLFDKITKLDEYYIPGVEKQLLTDNLTEINKMLGEELTILEPGSGNCEKVKSIMDTHTSFLSYIPVEISKEHLYKAGENLAQEYPAINIFPVCADYLNGFKIPDEISRTENLSVFFPGSSIGNYEPKEAAKILRKFLKLKGNKGNLLIGVDLKKEKQILEKAYNDSEGITAEFNLNLLHRITKELNTDLEVNNFAHKAFYNEKKGRIEMHLEAKKAFKCMIEGHVFSFRKGENIHTENSYKYSVDEFKKLGFQAGYKKHYYWTDKKNYFSIQYFTST